MTYEPGQQVLVRGEVRPNPHPVEDDTHRIAFMDYGGGGEVTLDIHAADVVGPAPATPDEGRDALLRRIRRLENVLEETEQEPARLRDALAAAEAERDAAKKGRVDSDGWADMFQQQRDAAEARLVAARALHEGEDCNCDDTPCSHGSFCSTCVHGGVKDEWPCETVRALSVEATGTEGGGEHE